METDVNFTMGRVRFVVPARNAATTLGMCLDSILKQAGIAAGDVIVVDNGSSDKTRSIASTRGVTLLECHLTGAGAARNVALRFAASRPPAYLVFVDADVVLPEGWLAMAVQALHAQGNRVAGVGGPGRSGGSTPVERLLDASLWGWDRYRGDPHTVRSLATMDTLYRYDAIAGQEFEEELVAGEDPDWCFRLREMGWELWMLPDLEVAHRHVDTFVSMLRKWFWYGIYYLPPYLRHPRQVTPDVLLRTAAAPGFLGGCLMLTRRRRVGMAFRVLWLTVAALVPFAVMAWRFYRTPHRGASWSPLVLALIASAKLAAHSIGIWAGFFSRPGMMWRSAQSGWQALGRCRASAEDSERTSGGP